MRQQPVSTGFAAKISIYFCCFPAKPVDTEHKIVVQFWRICYHFDSKNLAPTPYDTPRSLHEPDKIA